MSLLKIGFTLNNETKAKLQFFNSAHAFAADIFQIVFAKEPHSQEAWDKYRRGILEYGGSRNELEMLEEFIGRPTNPDALLQSLQFDL